MNARVKQVSRLLHRNIGHAHKDFMVKRDRTVKRHDISTQSIDFTAELSAKKSQTWRYAGGQILRAPSKMINGTRYVDPKDASLPRRKQESNFFMTINPNMVVKDSDAQVDTMKHVLHKLSQAPMLATYLRFGPKVEGPIAAGPHADEDYRKDKYADVVHSVEWKACAETGDVLRRLHAHVWLTVHHYSQVQINVSVLQHLTKQIYNQRMGAMKKELHIKRLPYVHIKLLPQSNWTSVMKQYIHKGMIGPTKTCLDDM